MYLFIIYVKYFSVALSVPSDDSQQWPKHVKAIVYIKPVTHDGHRSFMY
jgi:hypothetical protein